MARTTDKILRPQPAQIGITYGNIIRVLPPPKNITLDLGITELVRTAVSGVGIEVDITRQVTEEKPKISLEFAGLTLEVMELILGRFFSKQVNVPTFYVRNRVITQFDPPKTSGFEGFGIPADQPEAIASAFIGERSVPLTRQPFASFNPAIPRSFASGADGAVIFSDDLQGLEKSWRIPQTLNNVDALSENEIVDVGLILVFLDSLNYVFRLECSSGRFIRDGKSLEFSDETASLEYAIQYDGSTCLPYRLVFTGQQVKC